MKTKIFITKTNTGRMLINRAYQPPKVLRQPDQYQVDVVQNFKTIGSFTTNDTQLIDDIKEMNNDGFEQNLEMHETFEEVIETCLNRI
jgi:hypothetical protein